MSEDQADRPTTDEIHITSEMLDAGEEVLGRMTLDVAGERFWAAKIYEAMARLSSTSNSRPANSVAQLPPPS